MAFQRMHDARARHQECHVFGASSAEEFVLRFRRANRKWGWPISIEFDEQLQLLAIDSDAQRLHVARHSRIQQHLRKGISRRFNRLNVEYLLQSIPAHVPSSNSRQICVDVGANVGEVSRLLYQQFGLPVVAVEPDPSEFRALAANLSEIPAHLVNTAAWSADERVNLYLANEEGDTSIIAPSEGLNSVSIQAYQLDTLLESDLSRGCEIYVLKIEAEGAEPEVLRGAIRTLQHTRYVTADLGPERGVGKEFSVVESVNLMAAAGFCLRDFSAKRFTFLFENMMK